jgi:hypothetical protein
MKILLTTFNAKYVHSSLSLYSLRANVPEEYDVQLLELTINMPFMTCLSEVAAREPDILMFSTYIWNRERTLGFVNEIRKILPDVRIFLGGPEATGQGAQILAEHPYVEGIFMGEGEETFREFTGKILAGESFNDIKGLLLRDQQFTPRDYLDLDGLNFPYRDEDLEANREKLIYYESSRGCPFSCAYCLSSLEKQTRYKSLEIVYEELKRLLLCKPQTIKFVDRTFNLNSDRTKLLLRFICKLAPEGTCFHFEVSADLFDGETMEILVDMPVGLVQLEVGLQSTNPVTLEQCRRRTNVDKIRQNLLQLVERENIHIHLDLIAGLPAEDYTSFRSSLSEALAMRPHMLQLGFLKLLPGSALSADRDKYGIVATDTPPYEVLGTDVLNFEDLGHLKKVERALDGFYNSNSMRNLMQVIPPIYPGGSLQFFLDLDEHYQNGQGGKYKGMVRRFHTVWNMIGETGQCADQELLRDLLLFDYCLMDHKKFIPDFFLTEHDSRAQLSDALTANGDLLRKIHKLTSNETLKETYKYIRILDVSQQCYRYLQKLPMLFEEDETAGGPILNDIKESLKPIWEADGSRKMLLLDYSIKRGIFGVPRILTIK